MGGPRHSPMGLTRMLCECLEIIREQLCEHIVNHSDVSAANLGLMVEKSCLTNLLLFLDQVARRLENHRVEFCCVDFSTAFDSVN